MTPDQLITFSVVAKHRNITQAAMHLHLSQPAVSGQLQALQQSFGEALYFRQGRGIELTPAGRALQAVADTMHDTMEHAKSLRQEVRTLETGVLRLGASTTPASYLLPEYVARFRSQHPGIIVHMITGNTQQILEQLDKLDLAFIEGELDQDIKNQHAIQDWQTDEVVAIVPHTHTLATHSQIDLPTLSREFLVLRELGSGVRRMVLEAFEQAGLHIIEALELAGVEGVKEGVRAGLGIGFVSSLSLRHEDGTLKGLKIENGLTRTIRILEPGKRRLSHAARAFLNDLINT